MLEVGANGKQESLKVARPITLMGMIRNEPGTSKMMGVSNINLHLIEHVPWCLAANKFTFQLGETEEVNW